MERRVERALGCLLPVDVPEARTGLLEREGIVADEVPVLLDEGERGRRRLSVPLDRCGLAAAGVAVVLDRHVDDVRPVRRLAADHECLGEMETDDLGADVHPAAIDSTNAATSAAS